MGRRDRKAEKFSGSYTEVLDGVFSQMEKHRGHSVALVPDFEDFEFAEVRCNDCQEPVCFGTRELIEFVYLDFSTGAHSPH